jgi:hypothetical protein
MNTTIQITPEQREILLAGLRYVRSSVALEVKDWSDDVEAERDRQYEELDAIESMLTGSSTTATARV